MIGLARLTTMSGAPLERLGLGAYVGQDSSCLGRAFDHGVNCFFTYGPGQGNFAKGIAPLVRGHREKIAIASGSDARTKGRLLAARKKVFGALGVETLDVFFAEYVTASETQARVFDSDGALATLEEWKRSGTIRYVGATTHDLALARRLIADPRVDVLMLRFNMAHRKAAKDVFPTAVRHGTPVIAFTATRWATLLHGHSAWPHEPPKASDCYRYCLSHDAVHLVLTAPKTVTELLENLRVLETPALTPDERQRWERYGDLVYGEGRHEFDTRWT